MQIFWENGKKKKKNTFLVKNYCDKFKKSNFEFKMLKNHGKTQL